MRLRTQAHALPGLVAVPAIPGVRVNRLLGTGHILPAKHLKCSDRVGIDGEFRQQHHAILPRIDAIAISVATCARCLAVTIKVERTRLSGINRCGINVVVVLWCLPLLTHRQKVINKSLGCRGRCTNRIVKLI